MLFLRPGRLAAACRLSTRTLSICLFVATVLVPRAARAQETEFFGQVVDPTGRPLPRAYVRVLNLDGLEVAAMFTDDLGRFRVTGSIPQLVSLVDLTGCRLEAS